MEPHQQRVVDEKAALDALLAKLVTFRTESPIYQGLDPAEKWRLMRQERAMAEYSTVLGERIDAFTGQAVPMPPPVHRPLAPIGGVEMQEYLFAGTLTRQAVARGLRGEEAPFVGHIRASFRLMRFAVMGWLIQNGVKIPAELLDDRTHPEPGNQEPDRRT